MYICTYIVHVRVHVYTVHTLYMYSTCATLIISFSLCSSFQQIIKLSNTSRDVVTWSIGDENFDTIKRFKDGTFKFFLDTGDSFNPPTPTQSLVPGKIGCLLPNETFSFSATFSPCVLHMYMYM